MPARSAFGRRLRRYWWVLVAGLVAGGIGAALAVALAGDDEGGRAERAATCDVDPDGVVDLALPGDGDEARIARGRGDALLVDGERCGSATVRSVEVILIDGGDGDQAVMVDLSGGPLAPGRTDEGDDGSEIELRIDLGEGGDAVRLVGGDGPDRFEAGPEGLNLNPAEEEPDADVTFRDVESVELAGGGGDDEIAGIDADGQPFPAPLRIEGGPGDDRLTGGAGGDEILGGAGDDAIVAGGGRDRIFGEQGDDAVDYSAEATGIEADLAERSVRTADGRDEVTAIEGVIGGAGDDVLRGTAGSDSLSGGAGDDVLESGGGDDALDGGPGIDVADYGDAAGPVDVDLVAGRAAGSAGRDVLRAMENIDGGPDDDRLVGDAEPNTLEGGPGDDVVIGGSGDDALRSGPGADELRGGPGQDELRGDDGDDELVGGPGDDSLIGGAGEDALNGDEGTDTADYSRAPGGVIVDLGEGRVGEDGAGSTDEIVAVESVVGTADGDILRGDDQTNTLVGRRGDDVLEGGPGDDALVGGGGADRADYGRADSGVVVDLGAGVAISDGDGGTDDLRGLEDVVGSPHDDTLSGDDGPNLLRGGPGDDLVEGAGDDDVLVGGSGEDTVIYRRAASGVMVNLSTGSARHSDGGEDELRAVENVEGSRFADILMGDEGDNVLSGLAGADVIRGRPGDDTLLGGGGADELAGGSGIDTCRGGPGQDSFGGCEIAIQ